MATSVKNVVIVGGGIIGCSAAYHLSVLGARVTVIERSSVACAASGKAGGFLAKTWCDGSALGELSRISFEMHAKYGELFGDVDYRRLVTLRVAAKEGRAAARKMKVKNMPSWIDSQMVVAATPLGDETDTAQVHPAKLSNAFMAAAIKNGAKLIIGCVDDVEFSGDGSRVTAVRMQDNTTIECDVVVIAMGPWSGHAMRWFNSVIPAIQGQRAHSIVLRPQQDVTGHALFIDYVSAEGLTTDQEIYPRPNGEVYVCGMSDSERLPDSPDEVVASEASCSTIACIAGNMSTVLRDAEVVQQQACYLPISPDGCPLIGAIPGKEGAYIAAGHSCWGILNAPATGLALAELIVKGKAEVTDIAAFSPQRFVSLASGSLLL